MAYQTCEDCGCRVYKGHCVNCHEEIYIVEQHYELGTYENCSEEFKNKVIQQSNNPQQEKKSNVHWSDEKFW